MTSTAPRWPCVIDSLEPRLLFSLPAGSPAYPTSSSAAKSTFATPATSTRAPRATRRAQPPLIFQRTIANPPTIEHLYGVTAVGSHVFFTGTKHVPGRNGNYRFSVDAADILDLVTNRWSSARLSLGDLGMTTATAGSKTLFTTNNVSDIYDSSTHRWTHVALPDDRWGPTVALFSDKALIASLVNGPAGGIVDVYNMKTARWSTPKLPLPFREYFAIAVRDKALVDAHGGVDVYDTTTGLWSAARLSPAPPSPPPP
jgi:hypothetical protein